MHERVYEEVTALAPVFRKGWATSRDFCGPNLLYQERQAEALPKLFAGAVRTGGIDLGPPT